MKTIRHEFRWVLVWAVVIVLLASLPYIWGVFTPPGFTFLGLTHNIDDGAVYLSWMRQAADGHFFIRNLFTNEPQAARQFNLLFLLMGIFARITHLPLILVYHLFRVGLGIGLILAVWQFSKLFLDSYNERKLLIPLVGLSAGVGWLLPQAQAGVGPVDMWQPEAITFLSIYLNPLFLAGLILMLGAFYFLVLAQRSGRIRYAVYAGVALLLLGNIHTYDVVTVCCVWGVYLLAIAVLERKLPVRLLGFSLVALLICAPALAYQFYLYKIDPVYNARANTPIHSPVLWAYLAGYGLVLLGALVGSGLTIAREFRSAPEESAFRTRHKRLLLIVWAIVGFAVPYIPVAQQRKLIMGIHIPLCLLCAYALSELLSRLPQFISRVLAFAVILLMFQSNLSFMLNDFKLLTAGRTVTHFVPYMSSQEMSAMDYLKRNAKADDTILAPPTFALFTPVFTGCQVYYGHWSETPNYSEKMNQWGALSKSIQEGSPRYDILRGSKASYLVDYAQEQRSEGACKGFDIVFSDGFVRVYKVIDQAY